MTPHAETCMTCGDVAVEARVQEIRGSEALVRIGGHSERVAIDLVPGAQPGDVLLCHAGIALERIDGAPA